MLIQIRNAKNILNVLKINYTLLGFYFFIKLIQISTMKVMRSVIFESMKHGHAYFLHGTAASYGVFFFFFFAFCIKVTIKNDLADNKVCIPLSKLDIGNHSYILINLIDPDTECEQVKTLDEHSNMLKSKNITQKSRIFIT